MKNIAKNVRLYSYLLFTFDLGYGGSLPVIVPISKEDKVKLRKLKKIEFSEDYYISFDENYVSVGSVVDSFKFIELPNRLNYDFSYAKSILKSIYEFASKPVNF